MKQFILAIYLITLLKKGNTDEAPPLRLVEGAGPYEGRLEVFLDNEWGTVCDDFFSEYEATVVCRLLNFTGVVRTDFFGAGTGSILLDDLHCPCGDQTSLLQCSHTRESNCFHSEDIGVVCDTYDPGEDGAIMLVDGGNSSSGRVEIFHNREWGTVCDIGWDQRDADVVCRQLGYVGATSVAPRGTFPPGIGRIWLHNVDCTVDEDRLELCDWEQSCTDGCAHVFDAGVFCDTTVPSTITSTTNEGTVTEHGATTENTEKSTSTGTEVTSTGMNPENTPTRTENMESTSTTSVTDLTTESDATTTQNLGANTTLDHGIANSELIKVVVPVITILVLLLVMVLAVLSVTPWYIMHRRRSAKEPMDISNNQTQSVCLTNVNIEH